MRQVSVEGAENANVRKYEINQSINHQDDFRICIKKDSTFLLRPLAQCYAYTPHIGQQILQRIDT